MKREEQMDSCEICEFHKIIKAGSINIMSCHYGDYKNHPVWGDFQCPLEEKKPIREKSKDVWLSW